MRETQNINPYLVSGPDVLVRPRRESMADLHKMSFGNMPRDGGHLLLDRDEVQSVTLTPEQRIRFIRRIYGSKEFIRREGAILPLERGRRSQ